MLVIPSSVVSSRVNSIVAFEQVNHEPEARMAMIVSVITISMSVKAAVARVAGGRMRIFMREIEQEGESGLNRKK
jgi:hypothetical protein